MGNFDGASDKILRLMANTKMSNDGHHNFQTALGAVHKWCWDRQSKILVIYCTCTIITRSRV